MTARSKGGRRLREDSPKSRPEQTEPCRGSRRKKRSSPRRRQAINGSEEDPPLRLDEVQDVRRSKTLARSQDVFAKEWPSLLSERREINDEQSFVESRRQIFRSSQNSNSGVDDLLDDRNPDVNGISTFLRDFDHAKAVIQVDEVEKFCQDVSLEALESGTGSAGYPRRAWLDDRRFSYQHRGGHFRDYQSPLTATSLYRSLKKPQFNDEHLCDANRRLIYVQNLDKYYILALAETTPPHQVAALRNAIRSHLARQTSIQVHTETKRYLTFQLALHIPFFELRTSEAAKPTHDRPNKISHRQSIDLSFLEMEASGQPRKSPYVIREACFSVSVCGFSDQQYTVYCFDDREVEEDDDITEMDFTYTGVLEDPIASAWGGNIIDANLPFWDPREYFVATFEIRIAKILIEWTWILQLLCARVKSYADEDDFLKNKNHPSSRLRRPGCSQYDGTRYTTEAFDWYQRAIEILEELLSILSKSVIAWKKFRATDGDHRYFDDVGTTEQKRRNALRSLRAINETFDKLNLVFDDLVSSKQNCQQMAENLGLRSTLESNEATQHNRSTTEWTISVFSPIALTIAYFSMPQDVIPFQLNFRSWIIALLVITAIVRVLFFIFTGRFRRSVVWKKIVPVFGHDRNDSDALCSRPKRLSPVVDTAAEGIEMLGLDSADRV
ncbi:hypothetical protein FKW77_010088 [Venturia effusa]|uniref:Uncharacterized protein n=1 Tax=Venturia effusa TaxID=50376 RepID=A0A517L489_9PEZI|nr:hypothetical protein FKW77_010088 [Venturia effusa]